MYDCDEDAVKAILNGDITHGDVVVIRYEGPKGGPGMVEMYRALKFLNGLGLAKSTALITDGRFSGTNNGCFVGHISPEAAEGGPIAIVENGDKISIDVINGTLHLHLTDEKIQERLKHWQRPELKVKQGYLRLYARLASSADEGAVIRPPGLISRVARGYLNTTGDYAINNIKITKANRRVGKGTCPPNGQKSFFP